MNQRATPMPARYRAARRGRAVAIALLLSACAGLGAQGGAARETVWHDDFRGGHPHWDQWSRCAQPWDDVLAQCSASVAGPGEQIYWSPAVMRGGRDPVIAGADGGISILARPITADEQALLASAMTRQINLRPHDHFALAAARWTSGWMQTRAAFPVGTTATATIRPGAGAASWSGFWMLNDPAHRRWPPEIDVAEVTNDPDGRMHVRQVIHYRDQAGKLQSAGCPPALMARDWITVAVTRTAEQFVFSINGVERCRVAKPAGFDDPMNLILSQQVGGLAAHSSATTQPFSLDVRRVAVERP